MSSLCWSLPHLLTSSPPQHEAQPGQHDLLQDDTLHRAPLPEPAQSTSSASEPLSHANYESGRNPRNTPLPQLLHGSVTLAWERLTLREAWKGRCQKATGFHRDTRENLENKINKLQLLKKWRNLVCLNLSRHKAYSIMRWQRRHLLRRCPTSSPRCTSTSLWKALRTLISKMESYKSCWLHHCMPKELRGNRLHCFHQNVLNRETKCGTPVQCFHRNRETWSGVLCSETPICRIWVELCSKAIKITCWVRQDQI